MLRWWKKTSNLANLTSNKPFSKNSLFSLTKTLFQILLLYKHRTEVYRLINTVDSDHSGYNSLPEDHKAIARDRIKNNKFYCEYCWACIVAFNVTAFPMTAVILNIYNYLFSPEPVLYMVHDTEKPFSEPEDRFTSPFFEIMFAYMTYCAFIYILSFTGEQWQFVRKKNNKNRIAKLLVSLATKLAVMGSVLKQNSTNLNFLIQVSTRFLASS